MKLSNIPAFRALSHFQGHIKAHLIGELGELKMYNDSSGTLLQPASCKEALVEAPFKNRLTKQGRHRIMQFTPSPYLYCIPIRDACTAVNIALPNILAR